MLKHHWFLALPLAFVLAAPAAASAIRDEAGLFDPAIVREAEAKLSQLERESGVTTTIDTIPSLEGEPVDKAAIERARRTGSEGIYILIPKQEHKIRVLASRPYARALHPERINGIERTFINHFRKGDFDGGLKDGVDTIVKVVGEAQAESGGKLLRRGEVPAPAAPAPGRPMGRPVGGAPRFGLASLLGIGLVILAVLVGIRLLGSLFGGGQRAYGPGMGPGGPGMGPGGYGPGGPGGYGPGYGGRGGGFLSSLFGGIGGAMAGNWLYDQFSGRHSGGTHADNTSYVPGADPTSTGATGGDDWSAGTGATGDWGGGDAGTGDAGGGGDWGGGGGGDWGGGGGGDWGGGGGDWGGGGGGGDGGSW